MELMDLFVFSFLGITLLSLNFSVIGTSLVEKKLSLIGDTFSHAILPGVVLALLIGGSNLFSLLVGGWIAGALLIFLTSWISKKGQAYQDSTFAFLAVFFVAAGMIISFKTQTSSEILHLLFGNIFVFDKSLIGIVFVTSLITWILFFLTRHIWGLWILDPDVQLKTNLWIQVVKSAAVFILVTNLTLGLYSLGALMTSGLLVIPSLTAQILFTQLFRRVLGACLVSLVTNAIGMLLSFELDFPLGPSLVLISGFGYLAALLYQSLNRPALRSST